MIKKGNKNRGVLHKSLARFRRLIDRLLQEKSIDVRGRPRRKKATRAILVLTTPDGIRKVSRVTSATRYIVPRIINSPLIPCPGSFDAAREPRYATKVRNELSVSEAGSRERSRVEIVALLSV